MPRTRCKVIAVNVILAIAFAAALISLPATVSCESAKPLTVDPAPAQLSDPQKASGNNPDPSTGLMPSEKADTAAPTEKASETGIEAVIARMRETGRVTGDPDGKVLGLKDAIHLAIMNNYSIQIQQEEVEYAKGNILYATSSFLPQINAQYAYTFNSSVFYSDSLPNHRIDTRVYSGFKNENDAGITAKETIYNGGANVAGLKQARISLKVAQETLRAAKLDIEFEAKRLFYGLLLAYETKRIAQNLVDQAQAHYEDVKAMYGQGTASKFDVLQSKTKVSTVIPQLVSADNSVELVKADLKKLMVVDLSDPIQLDGRLAYKDTPIEEDEFLAQAYSGNPQMVMKVLGVDLNKWGVEFARAGWLPQVNANFNGMYKTDNLNNMMNPRHGIYSIGVTASMPLFDGFATMGKVEEARARYNQARYQKADYADQLAVDVRSACLDMKKARSLIEAQTDSVVEAKEALRLSEVRFDNGVGINLDVFDSEVSLAQVEQSLAQATYDYIMAMAQLDRLMGREYRGEY